MKIKKICRQGNNFIEQDSSSEKMFLAIENNSSDS